MAVLYVTSSEEGAGKTMICAGLGKYFLNDGRKVGFFKPLLAQDGLPQKAADDDALFLKQILSLEEPLEHLSPEVVDGANLDSKVKEALTKVSAGKDMVIVEGGKLGEDSLKVTQVLGARVIFIEAYSKELSIASLTNKVKGFGKYLLGIVANKVPIKELPVLKSELESKAGEAGINILGVLPEDRLLLSLTVAELAKCLHGEIISGADKAEELVESFMLGAMNVGSGIEYFDLEANKAAIIRSERSDVQLVALETKTRCLVLSGKAEPLPAVISRAKVKQVPIIRVGDDTVTIISKIEAVFGKTKFGQEKKLPHLAQILEQHFDFETLSKSLGLAG